MGAGASTLIDEQLAVRAGGELGEERLAALRTKEVAAVSAVDPSVRLNADRAKKQTTAKENKKKELRKWLMNESDSDSADEEELSKPTLYVHDTEVPVGGTDMEVWMESLQVKWA
jgi:hypothetical protein